MAIKIKDLIELKGGSVSVKDRAGLRNMMDSLIYNAVFEADEEEKSTFHSHQRNCKSLWRNAFFYSGTL